MCDLCKYEHVLYRTMEIEGKRTLPDTSINLKPEETIEAYEQARKDFADLLKNDGYVNEICLLGKRCLLSKLMLGYNTDELMRLYYEVYEPIKFASFLKLTDYRVMADWAKKFRKKDQELMDFIKEELENELETHLDKSCSDLILNSPFLNI